ncbi:hypothetical protein, partial [Saccharothrix lopnurensis]
MTLAQLIEQLRGQMATKLSERNQRAQRLAELRAQAQPDQAEVDQLRAAKTALDAELDQMQARLRDLEEEKERDEAADRLSREIAPGAGRPAYDRVARVGAEERTYRPDQDRRGVRFARDVAAAHLNDYAAQARLAQHMREEQVERSEAVAGAEERAVGTGAFTGLVVPQYLVDMFAPMATNGRPFADAVSHHDLPETGMTVEIGRGTTGTSVANQASENAAVSETDFDDTVLSVPVRTAAGQQTVSRQGVDRGVRVEDTIWADLIRRYHANLDSNLLNLATVGLSAVSTAVAYTDASPTALELYPKIPEALAGMEGALVDVATGENL